MTEDLKPVSASELDAIIAGCDGVTSGPWMACKEGECSCGQIWSLPADCPIVTAKGTNPNRPDEAFGIGLVNAEWGDGPDMIYGMVPRAAQSANAAHIARLDPQTILAMATELRDLRNRSSGEGDGRHDIETAPKDGIRAKEAGK